MTCLPCKTQPPCLCIGRPGLKGKLSTGEREAHRHLQKANMCTLLICMSVSNKRLVVPTKTACMRPPISTRCGRWGCACQAMDSNYAYLRNPHLHSCPENLHPCSDFVAAESKQPSADEHFPEALATLILLTSAGLQPCLMLHHDAVSAHCVPSE